MRSAERLQSAPSRVPTGTLAIEGLGVSKSYPTMGLLRRLSRTPEKARSEALVDVSFAVAPGETVGLLGPNGAGKTTLLKIVSTMLYATAGTVKVCGRAIAEDPVGARRKIGLVTSDERSFYWRLSGRQNLEFFACLYHIPRARSARRISGLLEQLGLADAADRPFYSYSSGMKQKMAIARGLLGEPAVVLYDEPTRALDPLSTRNIRGWLKANRAESPETAHLIATNQMDEAEQLCDRLIILNRGRVVASGTSEEIRSRFQQHAVHVIVCRGFSPGSQLRPRPELGILDVFTHEGDDGLEVKLHTNKDGFGLSAMLGEILARGGIVLSCRTLRLPLEDVICSIVLEDQPTAEEVPAS